MVHESGATAWYSKPWLARQSNRFGFLSPTTAWSTKPWHPDMPDPRVFCAIIHPMDLFADVRQKNFDRVAPLAARMRPVTLDEFVGQQHFLGPGKLLRRMLEADRLTSIIFYGPPGTGKTTLAQLIASYTKSHFEQVNAAGVGVKEVRAIIDAAKERLGNSEERTVLFIDEIHRFNRAQQDILLGDVEAGLILLIGATTENPFFAVNSPLVSRSQIFQYSALSEDDIKTLIKRAAEDKERGFGNLNLQI